MTEAFDLSGQTCIVTGATGGIGRASVEVLNRAGARLHLVARSREKAEQTRDELRSVRADAEIEIHLADLSSQADVRRVCGELLEACPRVDLLLNNAGVVQLKHEPTVDGIETMFAVNHLAYYLMTRMLLDRVLETPGARIVNVASEAHRFSKLDFDDLNSEKSFSGMRVYGNSKLANIMFTRSLATRIEGSGVTVNCLHPGAVSTRLGANNGWLFNVLTPLLSLFLKTPEQGASTSIFLCTSPEVKGMSGGYYANQRIKPPSSMAQDDAACERMWAESARLVGLEG